MQKTDDFRKDFLRKEVLDKHIDILKHKKIQIKDEILEIGRNKLGSKVIKQKSLMSLIKELNKLEHKGLLSESKSNRFKSQQNSFFFVFWKLAFCRLAQLNLNIILT